VQLDSDAAPDSLDVLPALLGESVQGRDELVTEGMQARTVLRQGNWVFIPPHDGPAVNTNTGIETGNAPEPQLYDLSLDIGQIRNAAGERTDLVEKMQQRLDAVRASRRTRQSVC
jgi:hypothetical protein